MKKVVILIFLALVLLNISLVNAAKIHGNIYNIDLEPAKNTILKINTLPEQTYVSKDATYIFTVSRGEYTIIASYQKDFKKYIIEEKVTIKEEGDFIIDLILFPDISEEEELVNEEIDIEDPYSLGYWWYIGLVLVLVFVLVSLFYIKKRKKPKKEMIKKIEGDQTEEVVKFIKEQGGRVTQKDIRKRFPVSEAKISLVIAELEHKGLVEKIKKGRGNIIILKQ